MDDFITKIQTILWLATAGADAAAHLQKEAIHDRSQHQG
ncbi:hypothetical protein SZ54_1546 [Rhizobium sp. UR51a]|jgi:hypothetical protein|nr:hypothetical protein SZ54_1546 [Rhizobium sp. UR51a]